MSSIGFELVVLLLLTFANGVFSMSEAAVISARKARLQQAIDEGDTKAGRALAIANDPDKFLSTVQIGITLIGILQGAIAGNTIAQVISNSLKTIPWLAAYSDTIGVAVVVLAITYLSLVIGELAPKSIALNNPEQIAKAVAGPMSVLTRLTYPIVLFLSSSTRLVLRLIGIKPSTDQAITEEEVKVLIEQGTQAGTFQQSEQNLIEEVFRLADRRASAFMTPRTDIVWLDLDDPMEVTRDKIINCHHAFFPVAKDTLDDVSGIVRGLDVLAQIIQNQPFDLTVLIREPLFVPEHTLAFKVLEQFEANNIHMALVLDEYGSPQGMVTFNNILQSVFSQAPSYGNKRELLATRRDDGSWLLDGMLPLDELSEILDSREPTEAEQLGVQTLGGFVMNQLSRIPSVSDKFTWQTFDFEVVDMDGRRVDKVLVTPVTPKS